MAIETRLNYMMADRKMSLNRLSEITGISNVNLSRFKTNKVRAVRFSTLDAVCEALECQPADLLIYQPETDESSK